MITTFMLVTAYLWYKRSPKFLLGGEDIQLLLSIRGIGGFVHLIGIYCKS